MIRRSTRSVTGRSFMRFLGLKLADDVPDSKTIWLFRERLTELGLVADLFALFLKELERLGMVIHEGKIVDASFVEVPKQRNSRDENAAIKKGNVPEEWEDTPNKLSQKDVDARWTQKNDISYSPSIRITRSATRKVSSSPGIWSPMPLYTIARLRWTYWMQRTKGSSFTLTLPISAKN